MTTRTWLEATGGSELAVYHVGDRVQRLSAFTGLPKYEAEVCEIIDYNGMRRYRLTGEDGKPSSITVGPRVLRKLENQP